MIFLNFSQLLESVFRPNFPGKHFPENQAKFSFDWKVFSVDRKVFPLTGKCFPLTNFPNDKQTQESLKSGFLKSEFREINMA